MKKIITLTMALIMASSLTFAATKVEKTQKAQIKAQEVLDGAVDVVKMFK